MLLGKLKAARKYTDIAVHGTMKLTAYFGVMSYCVVSRVEKLMVCILFKILFCNKILLLLFNKLRADLMNWQHLFSVRTVLQRPVGAISPSDLGAVGGGAPQQAGAAHVLARRVRGLP